MATLDGLRCTACTESALRAQHAPWDVEAVMPRAVACDNCGAEFAAIWGTPFIGHYEPDDVLGLIEIAANAREDNAYPGRQEVERLERLLRSYHEETDKAGFRAVCQDDFVRASWFENRYTEYAAFRALSRTIAIANRDILDVGAGTGYDTLRLAQLGGRVTALEYNPMLIRRGRSVVPEARWIGGFAHVIPFPDATFDVVCCNAALHHMRDVPTAMREMLRVVRPEGWLLTIGDPFRPDDSGDDLELEVFDAHPDVLLGVNESIPTFGSLVEVLTRYREQLDVTLLTWELRGLKVPRVRRRDLRAPRKWPLRAAGSLRSAGGSVAIAARVREPLEIPPTAQHDLALEAGDFASSLLDYDAAIKRLVPLLSDAFVDRPFPGERQTKFELLNGWQKPQAGEMFRTGFKRARWFLTRPPAVARLGFRARWVSPSEHERTLHVYLGGAATVAAPLTDSWTEVSVPLWAVAPEERFVCELRAVDATDRAQFDDFRFAVEARRFE